MTKHQNLHTVSVFSSFFAENKEKFFAFAFSYIRNKDDAEDILMDSMVALWESKDRLQPDSNLHALLLTIIKNKSLNYLAREQVHLRSVEAINDHQLRELNLRISTLEACDPESIFDEEIQHMVSEAINRLPAQSRRIFILSRHHNTPNKKIAEQLGISVKSVEFHMTKALKILRRELKDYLFYIIF